MAFFAHEKHLNLPMSFGATAAPPPTPSTQPNGASTSDAAEALSRLLHRLPPSLSLPTRLSTPKTKHLTSIPFSPNNPNFLNEFFSPTPLSTQSGFFQLTDHNIPPQLALAAEQESLSLLDLPPQQKHKLFSQIWPLGLDYDGDDEPGVDNEFCFNVDDPSLTESTHNSVSSLNEFANALERVGLQVVEALACALGYENPLMESKTKLCSLMWVSDSKAVAAADGNHSGLSGRVYPYVVALRYQIRSRRYSLMTDSGWVSVSPQVDSVLVTVGDIAQVWSNGRLNKVRGRPVSVSGDGEEFGGSLSMSLLLTLPMDSTVSTLIPVPPNMPLICTTSPEDNDNNDHEISNILDNNNADDDDAKLSFCSFPFEDYAWRVYNERIPSSKDPLDRYRRSTFLRN